MKPGDYFERTHNAKDKEIHLYRVENICIIKDSEVQKASISQGYEAVFQNFENKKIMTKSMQTCPKLNSENMASLVIVRVKMKGRNLGFNVPPLLKTMDLVYHIRAKQKQ